MSLFDFFFPHWGWVSIKCSFTCNPARLWCFLIYFQWLSFDLKTCIRVIVTDVPICTDVLLYSQIYRTLFYQPLFFLSIFRSSQVNSLKILSLLALFAFSLELMVTTVIHSSSIFYNDSFLIYLGCKSNKVGQLA